MLENLFNKEQIMNLILEFDERNSNDAKFAYYCDKLECDIQCKIYDEENCVDLDKQMINRELHNPLARKMYEDGASWSDMWISFDEDKCGYDNNFLEVSDYIKKNDIMDVECFEIRNLECVTATDIGCERAGRRWICPSGCDDPGLPWPGRTRASGNVLKLLL